MGFSIPANAANMTKANTLLIWLHREAKYKLKLISHAIYTFI